MSNEILYSQRSLKNHSYNKGDVYIDKIGLLLALKLDALKVRKEAWLKFF